jgi:hypothetical protein
MEEMRKQAYYDSRLSCKDNVNKYRNFSDPILQQNDNYVSNHLYKFSKENKRN